MEDEIIVGLVILEFIDKSDSDLEYDIVYKLTFQFGIAIRSKKK